MAFEALITISLGLLIIWIILSVAVNQISEWISILQLQMPARDLRDAIANMLQDDDLLSKFYAHRQIRALVPRRNARSARIPPWMYKYPIVRGFTREKMVLPSIISSAIFAEAMFDVLVDESLSPEEKNEELSTARIKTSIETLRSRKDHLQEDLKELFPGLGKPAILDDKLKEYKSNLANWYKNNIIHLVEKQRRFEQYMALLIGFTIAVILNVDMISIANYLWREPTIREALVQNAAGFELPQEQLASNPEEALRNFNLQFVGISFPLGWSINRTQIPAYHDNNCQYFPAFNQAFGIPLPGNFCLAPAQSSSQTNLVLKFGGFLITAFVARQGAPFWSDILRRLTNRVQQEGSM